MTVVMDIWLHCIRSSWCLSRGADAGNGAGVRCLKRTLINKLLEARKQIIYAIQRYAAERQYYVYLNSNTITGSWQLYVKNVAPNQGFDYGNRAAALWLD